MNRLFRIIALTASSVAFGQQAFSIDDAWQYAVDHNVNVQKAKIDRTIADQKVKETTGIGLPHLDAQGKYNYFLNIPVQLLPAELAGGAPGTYIPVKFGQKQNMTGGITLSQLLFSGSYLVGLQSAKAYKETAALAEEKTSVSVQEGIAMAYAGILVTDENIKTLEENRRVAEKALNDIKVVYKVGLTELQNVEQLEYSYKSLVANQQNLARTRETLVSGLKYLMNYPMEQSLTLTTGLEELVARNQGLSTIQSNYELRSHVDYRLKENALRLRELQVKLAKSKFMPTLAAALSSNYNAYSDKFTFLNSNQKWFNTSVVAVQLDVPIFGGFERHWQLQQAKLEAEKARLDLSDTERNLQNNAYKSAIDFDNAMNLYRNAQELIALSQSIYNKMQIKFKEGMATSTELQQAETQLYDSQRKYYDAAISLVQARTSYDNALGTLGGNTFIDSSGNTRSQPAGGTQNQLQTDAQTKTQVQPLQQTQTQQSNQNTVPPRN